jgi:hypothetical protein
MVVRLADIGTQLKRSVSVFFSILFFFRPRFFFFSFFFLFLFWYVAVHSIYILIFNEGMRP